jgi:6-phosphogluconolactonase
MKKILLSFFIVAASYANAQNPIYYMAIGTYTNAPGKSQGIYVYKFNPNKGEATFIGTTSSSNPSYLTFSRDGKFLYAVNENHTDSSGTISAFSFDKTKGSLTFLDKQPTGGDDPCYVSIDSSGKNVLVANYSGGNVAALKTNADGSLAPYAQLAAHEGYGVNVKRQEMPHPHEAVFSPDEKYVFTPDLGNDRLYRYKFNPTDATAILADTDPAYTEITDGSGPRHLVFSPNKKFAYLINELAGNIIVYQYDAATGNMTAIQTIASDNAATKDKSSAEIAITPDGKFLYTSNREPSNDLTIYKTQTDGQLLLVGHQAVGAHPRFFTIDPTGHFVLVANRDSNNIQIFSINKNYGLLENPQVLVTVDQPSCIKMVPVH